MQDDHHDDLLRALRVLAQRLDLQSRRIDREIGLTLPQLVVLRAVRDLGEVTTAALSRAAALSSATVVGILDKLEAKGLIERYRSTADRRIVHARLTAAGREVLAAAPPPLSAEMRAAFEAMGERRQRAALEALTLLAAAPEPGPQDA